MNKTVKLFGLSGAGKQQELGTVTWDGKQIQVNTNNPQLKESVLEAEIIKPGADGLITIEDGEEFLNALCYHFKSAYLRATAPEESQ